MRVPFFTFTEVVKAVRVYLSIYKVIYADIFFVLI